MSADRTALTPLPPGSWLGLMGGGQLGRMFTVAAQTLGYRVAVLDPAERCPAGDTADLHIQAAYDDPAGLDRLAERCAAITTEFENVPADSLRRLARDRRVSPVADAVAIAQDRIVEKRFISSLGVPVAPHVAVLTEDDLASAPDDLFPGILKAARLGYDGKGQARVSSRDEARAAFHAFGGVACVLEARLPLAFEVSVVVARGADGQSVAYPLAENVHRDGILAISTVPSRQASDELAERATAAAIGVADGLKYVGVMCVEFFVLEGDRLVVNEIAPRPHNSGHYSINACVTSQFEQQVRALAGLPLGDTALLAPAVMLNILGDIWFDENDRSREPDWSSVLAVPSASLHLYGKESARRARKMGHVTCVAAGELSVDADAAKVARALGIAFP